MIIRIEPSGTSFRGAGKYYLHDKLSDADRALGITDKPQTDERVWFTQTRNCFETVDPVRALDEMWRTADDQALLKVAAGVARASVVCAEPVKTIAIAWHKDDTPTPEHMIESADRFLKHMGWDRHQAVYIGHNDTEHRHIHIILNRVNPENGRTLDDYRDRPRAQAFALTYEKEQETIRCAERELNAALRENRAPDLEPGRAKEQSARQQIQQPAPTPERTPANDHLPHNVILLARAPERAFTASENAREVADRAERQQLKAEQRAEREAFFKDGAKLFKATRHAVYDEVRKEYAAEWRDFYKAQDAAREKAKGWSQTAIGRALFFARDGKWTEAREAFADRNSVQDAATAELAERKADLIKRQTHDLRTRQRDACDALRDIRDVQYQELLQRQREERAAQRARDLLQQVQPERDPQQLDAPAPANINERTAPTIAPPARAQQIPPIAEQAKNEKLEQNTASLAIEPNNGPAKSDFGKEADALPFPAPVTHQLSDLAAGAIGSLASYLADQLGELFAPTPPEIREANAKEAAKREAEAPAPEEKPNPYAAQIDAALRAIEQERQQDSAYWKDRDRGKGWERDR